MQFNKFRIYWPYFIFGAFIIVLIVNIVYVVVANDTWRGVFTENSYRKGLEHNKTLEKVEEQKKLGIQIFTSIKKMSEVDFRIDTLVKDKNNKYIPNLKVFYSFRYKPDSKYDFSLNAEVTNDEISRYVLAKLQKSGNWEIETAVSNSEFVVQDIKTLTVILNENMMQ
jgi:nitrogen fixation protein FixH